MIDRWEVSAPEEGDTIDQTVLVCNAESDGYEVIEIRAGTLAQRKRIAAKIAALLNEGDATTANPNFC